MQIIIPMTGYGSRFVAAGYERLKPFILIEGRPIIEWIVKGIYDKADTFIFVCRKEHLENISYMRKELQRIAPNNSKILAIDNWEKRGPVYDVLRIENEINENEPALISYCDFFMSWNYKKFKEQLQLRNCDGCIPCYTGFHPNLLPEKNLYASCRIDQEENLIEIREKYSFTDNKMESRHSPGVYYFNNGKLLKKYCQKLVDSKQEINGEYYASLPYNFMVEDGLKVWVPANVEKFCQWGTPEDMQEFLFWTGCVKGWERI